MIRITDSRVQSYGQHVCDVIVVFVIVVVRPAAFVCSFHTDVFGRSPTMLSSSLSG